MRPLPCKKEIRERQNKWRQANPDKVSRYYRDFYDRRAKDHEEEEG